MGPSHFCRLRLRSSPRLGLSVSNSVTLSNALCSFPAPVVLRIERGTCTRPTSTLCHCTVPALAHPQTSGPIPAPVHSLRCLHLLTRPRNKAHSAFWVWSPRWIGVLTKGTSLSSSVLPGVGLVLPPGPGPRLIPAQCLHSLA